MIITEVRKEDDLYYQDPFWIIGDNFLNILKGNFKITGEKYLCDYEGNYTNNSISKSAKAHKKAWEKLKRLYNNVSYTYYPRGRVSIYKGVAFIHLNSGCNTPKIVDTIMDNYNLRNLEIEIELNDTYQGSHYDFELE